MGLFVEMTVRVGWTPDGSGNTYLTPALAATPGQGQSDVAHIALMAQSRQYIAGEPVPVAPGSEGSVSLANINTAMDNCVSDIAGASGTPKITAAELAIIQGWASGNP